MPVLKVVLDANVLYPSFLRDVLLTAAEADFYQPKWTEDILEEVRRNLKEIKTIKTPQHIERLLLTMNQSFPDALIMKSKYEKLIPTMLNDPKDRHVLAAAVASKSTTIVTDNLKDFPPTSTAPYNIEIRSSDVFLLEQFDSNPALMLKILQDRISQLKNPPFSLSQFLNNLARTAPKTTQAIQDYTTR